MPILISWENNEKTIIKTSFVGNWTWADFPIIRAQAIEMMKSVNHQVDFIGDLSETVRMPKGAFSVGRSIINNQQKNEGNAVIIGTSPIVRVLFHTFVNTYPAIRNQYFYATSLDEAHTIIKRIQQNRETC